MDDDNDDDEIATPAAKFVADDVDEIMDVAGIV